jgi:hypothetical protein
MSISLEEMVERIDPKNTVLFFGAGSSVPSGAPSVAKLITKISQDFNLESNGYSLQEIASIAESKRHRWTSQSLLDTL